jgi:hypothetical protein
MVENHKFITAYFTNSERTVVESLWENDELGTIRTFELTAEEDNPHWIELLKHITIDELHERTYKFIRERNEDYEEEVIRIAKERNLIYDVDTINSNVSVAIAKTLFKDFDAENDKEALFMFKLGLFEVPQIKEAKNKELKAKLRKANTIVEALYIACEISLTNS